MGIWNGEEFLLWNHNTEKSLIQKRQTWISHQFSVKIFIDTILSIRSVFLLFWLKMLQEWTLKMLFCLIVNCRTHRKIIERLGCIISSHTRQPYIFNRVEEVEGKAHTRWETAFVTYSILSSHTKTNANIYVRTRFCDFAHFF